jgi:hypothetical protein
MTGSAYVVPNQPNRFSRYARDPIGYWHENFQPNGTRRPVIADTRTREQIYGSATFAARAPVVGAAPVFTLPPVAEAEAGRLPPPAAAEAAAAQTPLNAAQQAMAIGEPIPVVFCRRRNDAGGVLLFPKATEAAFSNTSTQQTARYHCVLGIGPMGSIQTRDFRVGACRVGSFSQNFDKRAGTWSPGNTATAQAGYQVPTFPTACGGGGDYKGLATLEFSNTTTGGTDDWRTGCNVFARDGLTVTRLLDNTSGPSDNIADLVLWAWQRSSRVPAGMIDMDSLVAAARFVDVNGLLCNGEFTESANIGDWLLGILPYFLLRETKIGGKFGLRPLLPTNPDGTIDTNAITPVWELGEDVIVPESFSQEWSDAGTRLAPKLTMLWRQQSETDMPIVRSLKVGLDRAGPAEQHDLSGFCATEIHAARVGAYMHGRRYLSTHTGVVQLRPGMQTGLMVEGDVVQVKLNLITGREPDALLSEWYVIEAVAQSRDGVESLQLSHFPVGADGRSLLALLVAGATAPGALLPFPAIGACDVAGRSTNTSVPASSTSGTPFSSGGSGITDGGGGSIPGGGGGSIPGGGFDESPVPDKEPDEREAPTNPGGPPATGGGLPGDLPEVPVGGSVPNNYLEPVNRKFREAPAGETRTFTPVPNGWQSAQVVFRVTGGGFSYSSGGGGGGAVGDADLTFTRNYTTVSVPYVQLCGGFVYAGSVSGQAAQVVIAASLKSTQTSATSDAPVGFGFDQSAATGFSAYAWIQAAWTITAGPTPQFIQIVSWTRTS